jgi:hypothetical protein
VPSTSCITHTHTYARALSVSPALAPLPTHTPYACQNFALIHVRPPNTQWHLGDLWDKKLDGKGRAGRWPAGIPHHSNPADHGFTEWDSSQSQLPTSTPNCGCFPAGVPPAEQPPSLNRSSAGLKFKHTYPGDNCVIGGGVLVNESFVCSTYWHPDNSTKTGVAPALSKIVGDDGDYMVKGLSTFIDTSLAKSKNFLATLWLHYIHLPHPAMPEYYDMYENDPDYVGALGQMDATFGDIVGMLQVLPSSALYFPPPPVCSRYHCILLLLLSPTHTRTHHTSIHPLASKNIHIHIHTSNARPALYRLITSASQLYHYRPRGCTTTHCCFSLRIMGVTASSRQPCGPRCIVEEWVSADQVQGSGDARHPIGRVESGFLDSWYGRTESHSTSKHRFRP